MSLTDFLALDIARDTQLWLFAAFFLAFAIKVPLFPLHTWLPDAHVEAPTAGSVVLAGVLLKMGIYGMLRFAMPLFPEAVTHFAPAINILAVIGIIYGALVALVQPDMKKLVAYSSVSHMGFIVLGLFSLSSMGAAGGIFQMLGHGLGTGALFLLVGIIYERRHTREISEFGGLAHRMPVFAVFFLIATLASIGLPGLAGFIGEFMILFGTFGSELAVISMLPLFFMDTFGLSAVMAGLLAAGYSLTNLVARPGGGLLSDRFGRKRTLLVLLTGLACGYLAMSRISSDTWLPLALAITMVCSFFVQAGSGAVFAMVPIVKRRMTGQIAGMTGAFGNVGAVTYLTVFSFVDYSTFFLVIAASATLVFAALFYLEEPQGHMAEVREDGSVELIEVA